MNLSKKQLLVFCAMLFVGAILNEWSHKQDLKNQELRLNKQYQQSIKASLKKHLNKAK